MKILSALYLLGLYSSKSFRRITCLSSQHQEHRRVLDAAAFYAVNFRVVHIENKKTLH